MSSVAFHTRASCVGDREPVRIRGWERAQWGQIVETVSSAVRYLESEGVNRKLERVRTWGNDELAVDANNAIRYGSDAVILAARLHAQCEIHCYVNDQNKLWLARLVETALEVGIFRRHITPKGADGKPAGPPSSSGYGELLKLLTDTRIRGPVVCSYSVCESFPWSYRESGEKKEDSGKLWDRAVKRLRKDPWLELRPTLWSAYRFTT